MYGNGRSYGDVCQNSSATLLFARGLNRFIQFDGSTGVLRCEAGVLLSEVLDLVVPRGWFLSVTPGTKFVTVGGAIANDVHGKNHHRAGSFGCHVRALELLRSDGSRITCTPTVNSEWFAATVGGLGLTGLITWAEIQLIPIASAYMTTEAHRFRNLDEFWSLGEKYEQQFSYTVAWVDCLAVGRSLGRGVYFIGEHAAEKKPSSSYRSKHRSVPIELPISIVNHASLALFNALYYNRPLSAQSKLEHYEPFFYPLDSIDKWNRIYGPKGFYQYQCVLPFANGKDGMETILKLIGQSGQGSFLAVLKTFGNIRSPGMLSFPRPGITLALDFPNKGEATHRLFSKLDQVVADSGGALYPAKDARMPGELFRSGFPAWAEFEKYCDPKFSSSFWRRVMKD